MGIRMKQLESSKRRNVEEILAELRSAPSEETLWEAVVACSGKEFRMYSGQTFSYELCRGRNGTYTRELWISRREKSKSLVWSSVVLAFHRIETVGMLVERPKALGDIWGVSYIYGIFYSLGLIRVPEKVEEKMRGK